MTRVAIAASSEISAQAGAELADAGGNAVDAVLGAALVSLCTDIGIVSPAGGALIAIWPTDGDPVVIDGCPEMPGRGQDSDRLGDASWEVVFEYGGEARQRVGFGSVATPGAFAAMGKASEKFGSLPWSSVPQPAIHWTQKGFPLRGGAAEYLGYTREAIYSWLPDSYRLLHHSDGSPLAEGDTVFIPGLADSLKQIASDGVEAFYGGELGQRIAAGIQAEGGLLNQADLDAYRATMHESITLDLDDWRIATCPPPSIGGPCLAAMLLLLRKCPEHEYNADAIRWLIEAQHAVLNYRARRLDAAGIELADEVEHLLELAKLGQPSELLSAPSTIHVSGVDSNGLACSLTASAGYGSGAMVPGTGIWLNNSLGEVDLHPKGLSEVAPGTRLLSNMAPSVARSKDGALIAIGSPGASRITTALAQSLWHHIHFGKSLDAAIEHPRLHIESAAGKPAISFERGLPITSIDGFELREFDRLSMYFGGVQAVRWSPSDGFAAVADSRRSGQVAYGGE
ncbi:MAG: gamma-glutamyltransferase [Betaproteobacteria bacterium]|nr:MAG: gamma-glutamyltransferase [Betaproteobacteria bacterium]